MKADCPDKNKNQQKKKVRWSSPHQGQSTGSSFVLDTSGNDENSGYDDQYLFPLILNGIETVNIEPDEDHIVEIFIKIKGKVQRFIGILDTGASLSAMHRSLANKLSLLIHTLRRKINVKTGNGNLLLGERTTLQVMDQDYFEDELAVPFQHDFHIMDNIPYDIIIGRPLMRRLRYRITKLEREYFRHYPQPSGVLSSKDNRFYDKLIDIPSIKRQQYQQQQQEELNLLHHHIAFIQEYKTYPNPLDIDKIRTRSTQDKLAFHPVNLPYETPGPPQIRETPKVNKKVTPNPITTPKPTPTPSITATTTPTITKRVYTTPQQTKDIRTPRQPHKITPQQQPLVSHKQQQQQYIEQQQRDQPRQHIQCDEDEEIEQEQIEGLDENLVKCGKIKDKRIESEFKQLCHRYSNIVSKEYSDIGKIEGVSLKLDLVEGAQPYQRKTPRRHNKITQEQWALQRPLLEDAGFITRSQSQYCHDLYYIPKKKINGVIEWRPIINYIPLNKQTIKDEYPLPNINNIQRRLSGKKIFSSLDLRHAYHHIEIKPEDRYKTAFIAPDGLWEWTRMSFGFRNAPAAMQRSMDAIFRDMEENVIVYIDDILIVAENEAEMCTMVGEVFHRLEQANIKLKLVKCEFFMEQLKYLGHIISSSGSKPDPEYVQRCIELREPNGVEDVKKINGIIQWVGKYIPHLSDKMEPLNKLRRKGVVWKWEDEEKEAFKNIKKAVKDAKILKHPNMSKPFYVICDASGYATGAVLLQEYDGIYYPIEFHSQGLDDTQRKWHISEKEIASVVWALEKWERYLNHEHFHIFTDHRNLLQLLNYGNEKKVLKSKLYGWILRLQEFDFTAHYITGAQNIADYFSRDILYQDKPMKVIEERKDKNEVRKGVFVIQHPVHGYRKYEYLTPTTNEFYNLDRILNESKRIWEEKQKKKQQQQQNIDKVNSVLSDKEEDEIDSISEDESELDSETEYYIDKLDVANKHVNWRDILDPKVIKQQQREDEILGPIIKALTTDNFIYIKMLPRYIRKQYKKNKFYMKRGYLHFRNNYGAIMIPPTAREGMMQYFHSSYVGLHQSVRRVYKNMRKYIYWFGMREDIKEYIKYCNICRLAKRNSQRNQGYLQLFTPEKPFEIVAIDLVGPLPVTKRGNRYILSAIDRFSRFVRLIPLQTITAENIAYEFRSNYLLKHGTPENVLSDRGAQFTGSIFKILCRLFGIKNMFTSAYHPETNGMIERFHRYLKERLRTIAKQFELDFVKRDDWDNYIAEIEFSYNNSVNEMTQRAPYEVVYGQLLRQPTDKIFKKDIDKTVEEVVDTINNNNASLRLSRSVQNYIEDLKVRQKMIATEMKKNMSKYDKYRKSYFDKNRKEPVEYGNLERVVVDVSDRVKGNKRKLNINRREGQIIDKLNDNVYIVQYEDGKREAVNINRIYKIETREESDEY